MPNWTQVALQAQEMPDPLSHIRLQYLDIMQKYTDRNIIAYYSAFLQKPGINGTSIDDNDKNAFMQACCGLDFSKGLDLILHTPGGELTATESIVYYLKKMFGNDIRVFVPQIAMSAGTMMALSAKEIVMGKQSNLGPIDPQYGGLPCAGILEEFRTACKEAANDPGAAQMWSLIISKYHPTFLGDCQKAIDLSQKIVKDWLTANMFAGKKNKNALANRVVRELSSHSKTYTHSRHIHMDELQKMGVVVKELESLDNRKIESCKDLQDCVLTVHHAFMQTLANSNALKIVQNQQNGAMALTVAQR